MNKTLVSQSLPNNPSAQRNERLTYRIEIFNVGPAVSYDIQDMLDPNVIFRFDLYNGEQPENGNINWSNVSVPAGSPEQPGRLVLDIAVDMPNLYPANSDGYIRNMVRYADLEEAGCPSTHCQMTPISGSGWGGGGGGPGDPGEPGGSSPAPTLKKQLTGEETPDGLVSPGELLTYTITVTNRGSAISSYQLEDVLGADLQYVDSNPPATNMSLGSDGFGGSVGWTLNLPAGTDAAPSQTTLTVRARARSPLPVNANLRNFVRRSGGPTPNCQISEQCVDPDAAGIRIEKKLSSDENGDGLASPGETLKYLITVTNPGAAVSGFHLRDVLGDDLRHVISFPQGSVSGADPDGFGGTLSWTTDLPASSVRNFQVHAVVRDAPPQNADLKNYAAGPGDGEPADCEDAARCVELDLGPGLSLIKQGVWNDDGNGIAEEGETITYTFTVRNTGGVPLNDITVDDPNIPSIPGSPITSLAAGASQILTTTYTLTPADIAAGQVVNAATVTGRSSEGVEVTHTTEVITQLASVSIDKAFVADGDGDGEISPGEELTYKVTLTNNTEQIALYDLRDDIDNNTTYVAGSSLVDGTPREPDQTGDPLAWNGLAIAANGTMEITYRVVVSDPLAANVTEIRNLAYREGDTPPDCDVTPRPDNCESVPISPFVVEKSLIGDADGDGYASPGEELTYKVTITNNGEEGPFRLVDNIDDNTTYVADSSTVDGVAQEPNQTGDPLVWNFFALPGNSSVEVVYKVRVGQIPAGVTQIRNVAYNSERREPNCDATPLPTHCEIVPVYPVTIEKDLQLDENGDGYAAPGEELTYRVILRNNTAAPISYNLTDDIDNNTTYVPNSSRIDGVLQNPDQTTDPLVWNNITVPANGTAEVTYSVIVDSPLPAGATEIRNVAFESGTTPPDCDNSPLLGNCDTVPVQLFSITKALTGESISDGYASPGEELTYTVTLTNLTDQPVTGYALTDDIDDNTVYVAGSTAGTAGAGEPAGTDPLEWSGITLPANSAVTVEYKVRVKPAAEILPGTTSLRNIAYEAGTTPPDCTASPAPASCEVTPFPTGDVEQWSLTKTAGLRYVRRGEQVPFTIRLVNNTDVRAEGLTITDTVPSGFRYVEGTATVNGVETAPVIEGHSIRFANLSIAAHHELSIQLRFHVLSSAGAGEKINRADVTDRNGKALAPTTSAKVEVLAEAVLDCGEVLGRVFDDVNRNGYPDEGERGLAGVRLATVEGWLITTDEHGRFHIACADLPDGRTGSNFIMKLDPRTLPTGYRLTTENPRVIRLTPGKTSRINFGASIGRVVRLDLNDSAFVPGSFELDPAWAAGIDQLIALLDSEPSVLRLSYFGTASDMTLARQRLKHVKDLITERFEQSLSDYHLSIETHLEIGE
ncbi:DUF11 domain-containing protein [Chelativorans sp. Marseille-P2723]|uniref:DUF7927 domain-containing protein n=1 Tax=Chelativorans sp. Marseille-P2723 TaxID=2709133 RepID=UPI00156EC7EA|nr:DUF11 domain-containing protein [Chelativorans sp. Marseille-P2723]